MIADIKTLGLKSCYVFKETRIPTSHKRHDIRQQLGQIIAPALCDLESQQLINGFHYIVHKHIDLRLSCGNWPLHESRIRDVLVTHSIPPDLEDWGPMPSERYGGEIGVLLCYNNLEFNSRLCLALAQLMYETDDEKTRESQEKLCPHQWVHYLCNQFGYNNLEQIMFELDDALLWLRSIVISNPDNRQVSLQARAIIDRFKETALRFEQDFLDY